MDCIFCKIVKGEIPAKKVYEDDEILAFHDLHPLRPLHVLVIPKKHIASLKTVTEEDTQVLGKILQVAHKIALENGSPDGFRVIINTDKIGGQEVAHLHAHILGGKTPVGPMVKKLSTD